MPFLMHQMMMASRRFLHQSSAIPECTPDAQGEHDGVVASRLAFACKDVVDDGGIEAGLSRNIGSLDVPCIDEAAQIDGKIAIDGLFLVKVDVDACAGKKSLEQIFGKVLRAIRGCQNGSNRSLTFSI